MVRVRVGVRVGVRVRVRVGVRVRVRVGASSYYQVTLFVTPTLILLMIIFLLQ
jgi:hypothetical protein